ncbi:MAG: hypothetical protein CME99_12955, partial [Hyphomonas sp.]
MIVGDALAPQKHNSPADGKGQGLWRAVSGQRFWAISGVDAQPLLLAFAMATGAAAYFTMPFEPGMGAILLAPLLAVALIAVGRRLLALSLVQLVLWLAFGVVLGLSAGAVRARLVA